MKRVPCLSCGVVLSNVGEISIEVTGYGGGTVEGKCPACGVDLSEYAYLNSSIIDGR